MTYKSISVLRKKKKLAGEAEQQLVTSAAPTNLNRKIHQYLLQLIYQKSDFDETNVQGKYYEAAIQAAYISSSLANYWK